MISVLVATNMYPSAARPEYGTFVAEQVASLRAAGVRAEVLAIEGWRSRAEYARAVPRLRRLARCGRFDVVHAHYGLTGAVALAARPAVPVVTTFHGSDTGYVRWQGGLSRVVARATEPVFVSRHGAAAVGLPRGRVIPAGVDMSVFTIEDRARARRRLGLAQGDRIAVFPGARANVRKDYGLFSAAVRAAERSVGPIRTAALEGLGRAEVAELLNAADVTVMTSRYEGSPVAVKESLAVGTPVVSVDVGDTAQLLGGLPVGGIAARDPQALAAAIVTVLEAGDASREALRARAGIWSLEATAGRLIELYRSLAPA